MSEVTVTAAGINHQTWFIRVEYRGEDWTGRLLEGFERHPEFRRSEPLRIDMLRRFGYWSTESNGHLSEYVPWYRKDPRKMSKWMDMRSWGGGITAGYLKVLIKKRNWFITEFPKLMKSPPEKIGPENRSSEHGSWIIESLETGRVYRGHFNVVNGSTITNLPPDAIVEVPGYVDRSGINVPRVGELPLGCAAVCNASISVQRLSVEAAARGDAALLKQAMMMDPLVGAVLQPPEIWRMTDEMLVAQARWLPQYRGEIAKARRRLASGRRPRR
jgi:alpha-galactosidase